MKDILWAFCFASLVLSAATAPRVQPGAKLPYTFEKNVGQTDSDVRYLARGKGYTLFLTDREAVMSLKRAGEPGRALRMSLAGAQPAASIQAMGALGTRSNYFIGNNPREWRRSVPHYSRVRYAQVYRGIDLVYHSQDGQLEYDFELAPGASPAQIGVRFQGSETPRVNAHGELELKVAGRTLRHRRPLAYQEIDGQGQVVTASYRVKDGVVGFELGEYDRTRPLVIDPVVVYSSYIGGSGTDIVNGVAVDKDGNMYLTGETSSTDFPKVGTAFTQMKYALPYAFIMKLNPAGTQVLAASYIGGSSNTRGLTLALDSAANVYLGGVTGAHDFPLMNPTQTTPPGLNLGFVMKLNSTVDKILFSTYLGGDRNDRVDAIAVDSASNIYVTGYCSSTNFPVVNAFQPKIGGSSDGQVTKYAAPDYRIAWSSFLGGAGVDEPYGIAVDAQGGVYVAGYTNSTGLATAGAYQTKPTGSGDSFVARVRPDGGALSFYTYIGANGDDHAQAIALEANGNILVGGSTTSKNLPVTPDAVQSELKGAVDAFLMRLNPTGTQLLYATYLGGALGAAQSYTEEVRGIAVDRQGTILLTGVTNASDFPAVRPLQPYGGGSFDVFLTALTPAGDRILYSTPIGGSGNDIAHSITTDATGAVYVAGETLSTNFPLKGALRTSQGSTTEGFLTKVCDPVLFLNPGSLTFVHTPGNANPAAQALNVSTCTPIPITVSSSGSFVRVSPTSATTNVNLQVTVDPTGLTPGEYKGTITVAAQDAVNSPQTISVTLIVAPPAPAISAAGIVNGATAKGGPIAPGELVVVYGSNVGGAQLRTLELETPEKVATAVDSTRVLFDGVPAPIVFVTSGAVSALVPYSVSGKQTVRVEVERYGMKSNAVVMAVGLASPGVFTANASGSGQGSIVNQDGTINGAANPAERGSVVAIYATGEGQTEPGGVDGRVSIGTLPKPQQPVRVMIDDRVADVLYAGAAPGAVAGVMQINVRIPDSARSGNVAVQFSVGPATSPAGVTVAVK